MSDNIKERNINEDLGSYNPRRVQDGGYKDKTQNQITIESIENRNHLSL